MPSLFVISAYENISDTNMVFCLLWLLFCDDIADTTLHVPKPGCERPRYPASFEKFITNVKTKN